MITFATQLRLSMGVLLLATSSVGGAADLARAEELVSGRCGVCHGAEGEARSKFFPRLAGQHAEYVAKQLADFKSGKRMSEAMQPQASELSPEEMKALGQFFQAKPAAAASPRDADLVAMGRYIFQRGNSFSGVPDCASCHGPKAHGTPQDRKSVV